MAQEIQSERFPGYRLAGPLGGRYAITRLLAAGGMAEVYEARDTVLDRRVAIKVLHAAYGADSEFVERFRREAMAAGKLNHPSIVQVYDWGRSEDGNAYMVMELVDGRTLRQVMNERGPLDPATAARLAEQVCGALEVARRAGIVHRDIKPENILITPDGRAKVADFGVARALAESRATQAGVVLGTASYLAPEQVEGHAGDHRSDLYALGTVLYEMVAGEPPFRGDNPVVVAYRRVAEDVPPLREKIAAAPESLETIVSRATARRPEQRYQTAAAMAADLAPLAREAKTDLLVESTDRTMAIPAAAAETQVIRRPVKRGNAKRRRLVTLVVAMLVVAGLVPLGIRTFGKVEVPQVAGLTQEAAMRTIEGAGLKAEAILRNDPSVPQGMVIATTPDAKAKVRRGTEIRVAVSLGPVLVQIPSVVGKTQLEATKALRAKKLLVDVSNAYSPTVKKGLVISQNPDPNVSVREGSRVTIVVSQGVEQVTIPPVAGKTADAASEQLRAAGFKVAVTRVVDEKVPRNTVIGASPAEGTKADKGSTVTLRVSDGPSKVVVPNVRGETYADAARILAGAGLKAARRQVPGSFGDTVVSQVPKEGSKVDRGSTIILYTA